MMTLTRGSTVCLPRFATPRDLNRTSLGPAVAEVARRLGLPLMAWQLQVIEVALELDPDGSYHYDEVVMTVPRQSGKTALIMAMAVHRLVVLARIMGRQRMTYTAQTRQKARLKLERDFAESLRAARGFREVPHQRARPTKPTEWKLSLNNGAENIQFGAGSYLQIDAPSRTGGHGDTLDVGVIDEAFAHQDDTIEAGMEPSMATRARHQLVVLSTAGDAQSFYLWRKILAGRNACETGVHGRTAYLEWSAPDDADPADIETWISCSPALCLCPTGGSSGACPVCGGTVPLRFLEGQWDKAVRGGQEGIDKFRRSYLNQWPEIPKLEEDGLASAFDMDAWRLGADPQAARGANPVFGVDVGEDRLAHVAVAWRRRDGSVQVMLAAEDLSPLRTAPRIQELSKTWKGPVILGGTSSVLEPEVRRCTVISGADFAATVGRFDDLLRDGKIHHGNQPKLNRAIAEAKWRQYGTAGERSIQLVNAPTVGPLAAVIRALHGLVVAPVRKSAPPVTAGGSSGPSSSTADLATMQF